MLDHCCQRQNSNIQVSYQALVTAKKKRKVQSTQHYLFMYFVLYADRLYHKAVKDSHQASPVFITWLNLCKTEMLHEQQCVCVCLQYRMISPLLHQQQAVNPYVLNSQLLHLSLPASPRTATSCTQDKCDATRHHRGRSHLSGNHHSGRLKYNIRNINNAPCPT